MPPQKSGLEATVIISTFGRADFIVWPLKSAQRQTVEDIEILVVGDGSSAETAELVREEAGKDPRIRFFDNPKGERNGERHRHQAVLQSRGKIICYLGHDDLWFPGHVEAMLPAPQRSRLRAIALHLYNRRRRHPRSSPAHLGSFLPLPHVGDRWNRFGPTSAAHTRDIYFDLPHGWRPAPESIWSDLFMWRQFINHPGCRFAGLPLTTSISFPRSLRREYSVEQREAELADWFPRLSLPEEAERLSLAALQAAAAELHGEIFHLDQHGA